MPTQMEFTAADGSAFLLRLANHGDVGAIRQLVNAAYKELSDRGLNYTATYQDDEITWSRMQGAKTYVLTRSSEIVGTILCKDYDFTGKERRSAYVGQFGIHPSYKRMGLGSRMMDYIEQVAQQENYDCIQLDTAKPATHLVRLYEKRGYRIIAETRFDGKTYESWIFEKPLAVEQVLTGSEVQI